MVSGLSDEHQCAPILISDRPDRACIASFRVLVGKRPRIVTPGRTLTAGDVERPGGIYRKNPNLIMRESDWATAFNLMESMR